MNSPTNSLRIKTDSLTDIFIEAFEVIEAVAQSVGINYLIVGATARDLVFQHALGANVERATRDIDLTILVSTWEQYQAFVEKLVSRGLEQHDRILHRLYFKHGNQQIPLDIVPFGSIADEHGSISWPPDYNTTMSVLGFAEAWSEAWRIQLENGPTINVVSPAGICLLKLVSWCDRPVTLRGKDAQDIAYLIDEYIKVPGVSDLIYDEGLMEKHEFEQSHAVAEKLGKDTRDICSAATHEFITTRLFNNPDSFERFVRDMGVVDEYDVNTGLRLMEILARAFTDSEQ